MTEFSDYDFTIQYNQLKERQSRKSICSKLVDGAYTLFWISPLGEWIDLRKHENAKHLLDVAIHMENKN
tara:strand:+ start:676 stop:882 length:207 start_codon:yes stop_codon:yes gene_type:complete